ncbi:MAG: hypothetical protein AB1Z57_08655 [Acidimicrobiia bacterium]
MPTDRRHRRGAALPLPAIRSERRWRRRRLFRRRRVYRFDRPTA